MTWATRIAPSPTGDMHLGTARTAYFNWLLARATGGTFLLRIDDTDMARNRQQCIQDIFEVMDWLNLDYDQLLYQSSRFHRYCEAAEGLIAQGLAQRADNGAVLLNITSYAGPRAWRDEIAGEIPITDQDIAGFSNLVLIKSDGSPTYNFATVVDDLDFDITYILRGKDHTTNTSKQVALWSLLTDTPPPSFAHVGLLFSGGKKLSKRDGAASMLTYKEDGVHPDALLNYMLRMGWGPKVDDKSTSLLTRQDALRLFVDGGNLRNASCNIDPAKLASFDRKYKARDRRPNG